MSVRGWLSRDFDLELSFRLSQVLISFLIALAIGYVIFRYTYLSGYSKETKPQETAPRPNPQISEKKPRRRHNNYLDEFLSAIKVFGYLEPSVFHELTKNMTTQKLGADELIYLDQNLGFSIVVDGVLQVYVRMPDSGDAALEEDEVVEIEGQRYQLLNEVKQGATLSSLISTLDLFQQKPDYFGVSPSPFGSPGPKSAPMTPGVPKNSVYPTIIAKAKPPTDPRDHTGATIAIIPATAFHRIQVLYPKATSHIVIMVLTRLYKVTLSTIHNYLGLTNVIIETEIDLNGQQDDQQVLPSYLYSGLVDRLTRSHQDKFVPQRTQKPTKFRPPVLRSSSKYVVLDSSRSKSSFSGDLLSSVPLQLNPGGRERQSSVGTLRDPPPLSLNGSPNGSVLRLEDLRKCYYGGTDETEESAFRGVIMDAIFARLGVTQDELVGGVVDKSSQSSSRNSSVFDLRSVSSVSSGYRRASISYPTGSLRKNSDLDIPLPKSEAFTDKDWDEMRRKWAEMLEIEYVPAHSTLVEQDSFQTALYYVINNSLHVVAEEGGQNKKHKSYTVTAGGLAGYVSTVVGFRSLVAIRTGDEGSLVAKIPRDNYLKLMDKYYMLQLPVAIKLKSVLSPSMLTIDYALEWCHIPAGQYLCNEGDMANGFHLVLSGRFRVTRSNPNGDGTNEVIGEAGHGESVGEVEVLTKSRRKTSLVAVRDSETARIPRSLFEIISAVHPSIMVKVSRIVAEKSLNVDREFAMLSSYTSTTANVSCDYKTITVMPTATGIMVVEFADKLISSLRALGRKVIALDQASTLTRLGRHAFDEKLAELRLSGYFAYLEEEYDHVIYVCDSSLRSHWTSTCISQGDCILLVADADDAVTMLNVGDYERVLMSLKTSARADLCLLHREKYVAAGHTSQWLKPRPWLTNHHHIHMVLPRVGSKKKQKSNLGEFASMISRFDALENVRLKAISSIARFNRRSPQTPTLSSGSSHKNDFMRLARILSNEAVGLVLGGGGARGISHIGVITALERRGIPVDIIGGTSIGSFVGGLYAKDYDAVSIYGRSKQFSRRVSALWRMVLDLTYPITSYTTGYEFNRGIWKSFGNYKIEDFWLQYFCNSTNITNSTMDIHESGFSWRFIRASMSLAGLLPPIAYKGCMLLDGGYLDNLPVMEMKKKGAKYIFAVDVGSQDDRTPQSYGDTLSGFWVVFNRWNPFSKYPNVPNMTDIQLRLAYVSSVKALEIAKRTPGVFYLRPPVEDYATLDFAKFEEIYHVGLDYGEVALDELEHLQKLHPILEKMEKKAPTSVAPKRRNSI